MATQTYLIPECNLAELEIRIAKLNKRAVKLGVDPIVVTKVVDHVRYRVRQLAVNGEMNLAWVKSIEKIENPGTAFLANAFEPTGEAMAWWNVTVTGQTPALSGWKFVAVLEPLTLEDGTVENLVQSLPGQECPDQFRTLIGHCDHCQTVRKRNQTFVVENPDGFKCVGRQCLKDFLGYNGDPHKFASWAESLAELGTLCGDAEGDDWLGGGYGRGGERSWDLKHFLTLTACRVRLFGWLGRGKARDSFDGKPATADVVLQLLTPPNQYNREEHAKLCAAHVLAEVDSTEADNALEWAKAIPEEERQQDGGFLANVNLVARVGTAARKTAGIAAAIIIAYRKATEREINRVKEASRPVSNWVGVIGKRFDCVEVTCEKVIMNETDYGVTGIHKMTDAAGNDLVWFASAGEVIEAGDKAFISAGVKDHGEFRGRKQTVLTRVTVWTAERVAEFKAKQERKAAREAKKAAKAK